MFQNRRSFLFSVTTSIVLSEQGRKKRNLNCSIRQRKEKVCVKHANIRIEKKSLCLIYDPTQKFVINIPTNTYRKRKNLQILNSLSKNAFASD